MQLATFHNDMAKDTVDELDCFIVLCEMHAVSD